MLLYDPPRKPDPKHVPTEAELRRDLAAAYRLIALHGVTGVGDHVGAQESGGGRSECLGVGVVDEV